MEEVPLPRAETDDVEIEFGVDDEPSTGAPVSIGQLIGSSPLVAKGQLALRKDPAEALQVAEQILNNDPYNSAAHRILVEAATALELTKTAVLSLEILVSNSPKDRDVAIKFADALADTGEVVRAEQILVDLSAAFPSDQDLSLALKNISARKTMQKGGYEEVAERKGTFRDILKNKEEAISLEQENRHCRFSPPLIPDGHCHH